MGLPVLTAGSRDNVLQSLSQCLISNPSNYPAQIPIDFSTLNSRSMGIKISNVSYNFAVGFPNGNPTHTHELAIFRVGAQHLKKYL